VSSAIPRSGGSRPADPLALDVLSDALGFLRLRGEVLCWSDLSAPWALGFGPDDALFFHVVEHGTCLVHLPGTGWTQLSSGDLAVLPAARGHVLASSEASRVVPVMSLVEREVRLPGRLRYGGGGARTRVLCGRFRFDARLAAGLLNGFPPVLVVRGSGGRAPEWLRLTTRLLAAEGHSDAPGRSTALSHLVDLLFVLAVRHWLSRETELPPGWISALRDPRIAVALSRIHAAPAEPWSVPSLARAAGMSRSSFADRFVALLGEPPNRYLARWRVHLATRMLRSPGTSTAQVASRVGYESEAAFARAFRRILGVTPGAFRRESLSPASGPRRARARAARG
jgi:AraC-like DNA-binding protein